MTCHELRLYFQSPVSMDAEFPGEAEHLARCTECARLVEERHELAAALRLVRESAPEPSAALETAVLTNYRRWVATHPLLVRSRSRRLTVVCWTAAVAGVLILAAVFFHPARRLQTSNLKIEDRLAAADAAAEYLRERREGSSLEKHCCLAENTTAFLSATPPRSATRDHEESSFRRLSQLDVL